MRTFNAQVSKQASALLAQGGASDDDVKSLIKVVGSTYREHDELDVRSSVKFVVDAISASAAGFTSNATSSKPSTTAAKSTKASKKAAKATKQQEAASKAKTVRRNAKDLILLTALENGWKVTEHKLGSDADKEIRMLHSSRGRRNWSATARKGKATFHVTTIVNPNGGIHPDGCWLYQDGKTVNVEMLYEVLSVLSTPLTKEGFAVKLPKEDARQRAESARAAIGAAPEKAAATPVKASA